MLKFLQDGELFFNSFIDIVSFQPLFAHLLDGVLNISLRILAKKDLRKRSCAQGFFYSILVYHCVTIFRASKLTDICRARHCWFSSFRLSSHDVSGRDLRALVVPSLELKWPDGGIRILPDYRCFRLFHFSWFHQTRFLVAQHLERQGILHLETDYLRRSLCRTQPLFDLHRGRAE